MQRAGIGRRFPAFILDLIFVSVLSGAALFVYAVAAGAGLFLETQEALGMDLTISSLTSDRVWEDLEDEMESVILEFEQRLEEEFTDEQAQIIGRTMSDYFEQRFDPETMTVEQILALDAQLLDQMIDEGFNAVLEANPEGISESEINELRQDTKALVDDFALGQIIPSAIRFAVWFALIPILVILAYGFSEALSGRTLGKLLLGIAVTKEGEGVAIPNLILRYGIKYSAFLFLVLVLLTRIELLLYLSGGALAAILLGSLSMFGPERRAMHDYLSGTVVARPGGRR